GRSLAEPPDGLTPETVVRRIARRQHHAPAPGSLAREHHGAPFAEALHGDEGARRAAGSAGDGEHRRAAPRGEIDASDGTSFHFLRFSSDEGASCITGCASPSAVSATRFMPGDADAGT